MHFDVEKSSIFKATDHTLAKNVAEKLEEKYPGWLWAEILERFRQKRGEFNDTLYSDLKMDHKGKLNGEYS